MKLYLSRVFFIIIVVLVTLVVLYSVFFYEPHINTPEVILPTAQPGELYPGGNGEGGVNLAAVTPSTVQSVIAELERAENYSRTVTVTDYWPGGSSSQTLSVWVSGSRTKLRVDSGTDVQNILLDDGELSIWYDAAGGFFSGPYSGETSTEADKWLRSITYEDLLNTPMESITSAGYVEYSGVPCIFAEWTSPNFGYTNRAYVSVGAGLLMGSETYDGAELIYHMSSTEPELTVPDEGVFSLSMQNVS